MVKNWTIPLTTLAQRRDGFVYGVREYSAGSPYKHRLLAIHNHNISRSSGKRTPTCRSSSSRSSISCACRHGQLRSTYYRWRARLRILGCVIFLAPRLGFAITITSRPIPKTPSSGKSVLNCRRCFCWWYVLVFRRMYVELTRVENTTKLYQFDAMLPDKIRRGVLYWFTYGMNNQREYKFCEVRHISKRCIEFHYTKSVTADLDMYRLVYETTLRGPWAIRWPRPRSITGRLRIIRHQSTPPMVPGLVIGPALYIGWGCVGSLSVSRARLLSRQGRAG